jgi:iron complex outermembrane receptor protein
MTSPDTSNLRTILRCGASGLAVSLAVAAGAAHAQDAASSSQAVEPDNAVEEVVVTGFRASLASAINVKRNASGVVDAIKAEDIAQFPDLNLAESLQRIPGVAISRINGEGRQISVRGLGSEYTRVRINGMEAITTTGGTANSGGTNRGRGFDFNIFASDLFNSIAVRKTASADVEEGSLGATVDLNTARPFDSGKPQLVLSAQASYNDLARKAGPRLSALASRTWRDGTIGALVSVAYEDRRLLEEGANITRWTYGGSNGGFNAASTLPGYTLAQINTRPPHRRPPPTRSTTRASRPMSAMTSNPSASGPAGRCSGSRPTTPPSRSTRSIPTWPAPARKPNCRRSACRARARASRRPSSATGWSTPTTTWSTPSSTMSICAPSRPMTS